MRACDHGLRVLLRRRFNHRLGTGLPYKPGHRKDIELFLDEKMLTLPLRWKKPRKVFVFSMSDLFADFVTDEQIDKVLAVMALCPQHTFQVLTKRAERMRDYVSALVGAFHASPDSLNERFAQLCADLTYSPCAAGAFEDIDWPLPNVWLGVSTERQQEADERIPLLLQTPAAVRFISAEPLLGPINLKHINVAAHGWQDVLQGWRDSKDYPGRENVLDWVIVGGESGPRARSWDIAWAQRIIDDCRNAGVACFVKQLGLRPMLDGHTLDLHNRKGGWMEEWPGKLAVREFPSLQTPTKITSGDSQVSQA